MQLVSNVTSCTLDRPDNLDMSSLGAAFLAGLAVGMCVLVTLLYYLHQGFCSLLVPPSQEVGSA